MDQDYEYINQSMILLELESNSRDNAIKELANLLEWEDKISSKEVFVKKVLEREKLASTYCGMSTAIPHAVSTVVKEPAFCFGRSKGFNWNASDEPVRFVFLLAIPVVKDDEDSKHIDILSSISELILEADARRLWEAAKTKEEIFVSMRQICCRTMEKTHWRRNE